MSSASYQRLITDFCELIGMEYEAGKVLSTGAIQCDDVTFSLLPSLDGVDAISVFTAFGDVPSGREIRVYRRLLEVNVLVPLDGGPRLGIDEESGKVIMAFRIVAPTPTRLLLDLQSAVRQAQAWRTTFYLDDDEECEEDARRADLHRFGLRA
jgi:hypothetical protein